MMGLSISFVITKGLRNFIFTSTNQLSLEESGSLEEKIPTRIAFFVLYNMQFHLSFDFSGGTKTIRTFMPVLF